MSKKLALLLEPRQLLAHLGDKDLLILDVSSAGNYTKHHIPGAIHIDPSSLQSGQPPAPGKLPTIERLTQLFSTVGLSANKHVIAYDDEGGGWAGRLVWTLDVLGHSNYSYLNGGLHAWVNEGHITESGSSQATTSDFQAQIDPRPIANIEEIMAKLGDTDTVIWDARSIQEYDASKIVAKRGGHIPGAINIDWLDLIDRNRNMRLVDLEKLQTKLNKMGITKNKCVITHCQTHHRSGLSYLAMKILGYSDIKGYDGSWSEWGNREDTPIET